MDRVIQGGYVKHCATTLQNHKSISKLESSGEKQKRYPKEILRCEVKNIISRGKSWKENLVNDQS